MLTIPARGGLLLDRFGARETFKVLCFMFAVADDFEELVHSRFLFGFVYTGFVTTNVVARPAAVGSAIASVINYLLRFLQSVWQAVIY